MGPKKEGSQRCRQDRRRDDDQVQNPNCQARGNIQDKATRTKTRGNKLYAE